MVAELETVNMSDSYEAPPSIHMSVCYGNWIKEVKIWQNFTCLDKCRQGPALFFALEEIARESILELDIDITCGENAVESMLGNLDALFLSDKVRLAYKAYENFEKIKRPCGISINYFVNKFERLKYKVSQFGTHISTNILAFRQLKAVNLSQNQ